MNVAALTANGSGEKRLHRISALNDPDQHGDNRKYQEDVNESAQRVRTDHTQQPQNQQNYSYGPEHLSFLVLSFR
jgi:hypothetical protein